MVVKIRVADSIDVTRNKNNMKTNSAIQPWHEKASKRQLFFIGQKQTSGDKVVDNDLNENIYI
jgi:hypothetical protein